VEVASQKRPARLLVEGPPVSVGGAVAPTFVDDAEEARKVRSSWASEWPDAVLLADWPGATAAQSQQAEADGYSQRVLLSNSSFAFSAHRYLDADEAAQFDPSAPAGRLITGFQYTIIPPVLRLLRPPAPAPVSSEEEVFFSFGGSDPWRLSELVAAAWTPAAHRAARLVLGPAVAAERRSALLRLAHDKLRICCAPQDFHSLLLQSQALVCIGGQTAYEACYLGVPVIGVRWPGNERYLTAPISRGIFADGGHPAQLVDRLTSLLDDTDGLRESARRGYGLIDGSGPARIIETIDESLGLP
jgi:hypothetical protein